MRIDKRETKFRAWLKAESKMCEVGLIRFGVGAFLLGAEPGSDIISSDGKFKAKAPDSGRFVNNEEFELMQFTGLKDKNGKEIYESDILEYPHREVNDDRVVTFIDGGFMLTHINGQRFWPYDNEVIGNIYENPFYANRY
jgi:uncharacterized phage protein (TIGR01671 family)